MGSARRAPGPAPALRGAGPRPGPAGEPGRGPGGGWRRAGSRV